MTTNATGTTDADGEDENNGEFEEYADLGATTENAMEIAETSMEIVRQFVPDETLADRVRQKAVHSTGDIEFQHLLRFTGAEGTRTNRFAPARERFSRSGRSSRTSRWQRRGLRIGNTTARRERRSATAPNSPRRRG